MIDLNHFGRLKGGAKTRGCVDNLLLLLLLLVQLEAAISRHQIGNKAHKSRRFLLTSSSVSNWPAKPLCLAAIRAREEMLLFCVQAAIGYCFVRYLLVAPLVAVRQVHVDYRDLLLLKPLGQIQTLRHNNAFFSCATKQNKQSETGRFAPAKNTIKEEEEEGPI